MCKAGSNHWDTEPKKGYNYQSHESGVYKCTINQSENNMVYSYNMSHSWDSGAIYK